MRGEHLQAIQIGREMLSQAQAFQDTTLLPIANTYLAWTLLVHGEVLEAHHYLQAALQNYDKERDEASVYLYGHDIEVTAMAWESWVFWFLGNYRQAEICHQQAISLARERGHAFTIAFALSVAAGSYFILQKQVQDAGQHAEELISLAEKNHFAFYLAEGLLQLGWSQVHSGQGEIGLVNIQNGIQKHLNIIRAHGGTQPKPGLRRLVILVEAFLHLKRLKEAEGVLWNAIAMLENIEDHLFEAEIYRLLGETLCEVNEQQFGEEHLHQAIEIARTRSIKSFELRATISLCRLWSQQGREYDALTKLEAICSKFSEDDTSVDLETAVEMKSELSKRVGIS
jgi:tetratricopeptide (TPR) repeat protein